ATTMRMVSWVHHRASHGWTTPQMTRAPSLTKADILMIDVSDLSDGRHAEDVDVALLSRRQTNERIIALFCHQLRANTCTTHKLSATSTLQFDVVNGCTGRDVLQRQCITDPDVCFRPCHYAVPNVESHGCQDVALLAIYIVQEGDTC